MDTLIQINTLQTAGIPPSPKIIINGRKIAFQIRPHIIFSVNKKNPKLILSYGNKRQGPTLRNLAIPRAAESIDKQKVAIVCRFKTSITTSSGRAIAIERFVERVPIIIMM